MEPLSEVYPEDRALIEKLAKLQDMHQQNLRGLLPGRLLKPTRMALANPRDVSPEKMAANLKTAATDGSRDIQRFKKDFNGPEMRELWQNASTADYSQGRDAWTVDYQKLVKESNTSPMVPGPLPNGDAGSLTEATEVIEKSVEQFRTTRPSAHVDYDGQPNMLPINIKLDGLSLQLTARETDGRRSLFVRPLSESQASELETQIANHINEHKLFSDLDALMNLIASYSDIKFQPCSKCDNIFDDKMNYAWIRRRKAITDKESKPAEWLALHRGCVV